MSFLVPEFSLEVVAGFLGFFIVDADGVVLPGCCKIDAVVGVVEREDLVVGLVALPEHFASLGVELEEVRGEALEWSTTRGSRSGRVAWQFVVDLAGRLGKNVS